MTLRVYGFPATPAIMKNVQQIHQEAGGGFIWDIRLPKRAGFFDTQDVTPEQIFGGTGYAHIGAILFADYPTWEKARRSIPNRTHELTPWMQLIRQEERPVLLMDWASHPIQSMRGALGELLRQNGFLYDEWRKRPLIERRTHQINLFAQPERR